MCLTFREESLFLTFLLFLFHAVEAEREKPHRYPFVNRDHILPTQKLLASHLVTANCCSLVVIKLRAGSRKYAHQDFLTRLELVEPGKRRSAHSWSSLNTLDNVMDFPHTASNSPEDTTSDSIPFWYCLPRDTIRPKPLRVQCLQTALYFKCQSKVPGSDRYFQLTSYTWRFPWFDSGWSGFWTQGNAFFTFTYYNKGCLKGCKWTSR